MNDTVALVDLPAGSRKRDAEATRAAILEAAKTQFAVLGYDCTVLRDIAREAGVDVALVKRYFGGKEALFLEALKASFGTDDVRGWDRATFAHEVATVLAGSPHIDEARTHRFQFLLRAATSPTTAPLLNMLVQDRLLGPIREWLGGAGAGARAHPRGDLYRVPCRTPDPRRAAAGPRTGGILDAGDGDLRGVDYRGRRADLN